MTVKFNSNENTYSIRTRQYYESSDESQTEGESSDNSSLNSHFIADEDDTNLSALEDLNQHIEGAFPQNSANTCYDYDGLSQPGRSYSGQTRQRQQFAECTLTDPVNGEEVSVKRDRRVVIKEVRRPVFVNINGINKMAVIISKSRKVSLVTRIPKKFQLHCQILKDQVNYEAIYSLVKRPIRSC